jgi:CxxC motif-containing protein
MVIIFRGYYPVFRKRLLSCDLEYLRYLCNITDNNGYNCQYYAMSSVNENHQRMVQTITKILNNSGCIVNVKAAHIRPKYNNLEEWMADSNNVYVGRHGRIFIITKSKTGETEKKIYHYSQSIFHNPYVIDDEYDRNSVIDKYFHYLVNRLDTEPDLVRQLNALTGKNLGCWCKPDRCHADVLLKVAMFY